MWQQGQVTGPITKQQPPGGRDQWQQLGQKANGLPGVGAVGRDHFFFLPAPVAFRRVTTWGLPVDQRGIEPPPAVCPRRQERRPTNWAAETPRCRRKRQTNQTKDHTFFLSAPVAFRRVALETPEWTSRDSNHHRQSVSAGKTNTRRTEPPGRLTKPKTTESDPHNRTYQGKVNKDAKQPNSRHYKGERHN